MKIQTVLGPIDSQALGRTLFHEHLFLMFPGAEFDLRPTTIATRRSTTPRED